MKSIVINSIKLMIFLSSAFLFQVVQAQSEDERALKEIDEHRKKQEAEFRDPEKSPLEKKDRKKFKGLRYYPVDLKYRVKATFVRNEHPVLFKMKTSGPRLPDYTKYGEVHFAIDGQEYTLEVYQSLDLMKRPGFEDYLFIPFTDATNGKETYDVGRYLEFHIPNTENVVIDFNQCYNPSCSYSAGFSCPIPPEANALPIEVKAGELKFKEHH